MLEFTKYGTFYSTITTCKLTYIRLSLGYSLAGEAISTLLPTCFQDSIFNPSKDRSHYIKTKP